MQVNEILLNKERNVLLSAWIQEVGGEFRPITKRPAVLVLPGGGYSMCSDREADPVAAAYLKAGYQAFILRYSVGEHRTWPNPLTDYEQAITLIRKNADQWHVDENRIAVIGFSAGGHLAACAATIAENRPNAVILGYAALKKEISDVCQPNMPYPVELVDEKTPACFLFATRDDVIVDISNTIDFQKALAEKGIRFEAHIYSYGQHGFSNGETWLNHNPLSRRVKNWTEDSIEWLSEIWGEFCAGGFAGPVLGNAVNADYEEFLSMRCTIAHLKKQGQQAQNILADAFQIVENAIVSKYENPELARPIVYAFQMADLYRMMQVPQDVMLALEAELQKIPNEK